MSNDDDDEKWTAVSSFDVFVRRETGTRVQS